MASSIFDRGLEIIGVEKPGPEESPIDHGIWAFAAVTTSKAFHRRDDPRTRLDRPRDAVAYLMGPGHRQVTWTPEDGSEAIVVTSDEEAITLPPGRGVGEILGDKESSPLVMPTGEPDELLTPTEAAEVCGVHRNTIHRWRKDGRHGVNLCTTWIGGLLRIRRGDLDDFISSLSDPKPIDESSKGDDHDERMRRAAAACEALGC